MKNKAIAIVTFLFVFIVGCKRNRNALDIIIPTSSSLDSCNYFANQGFEFRKGRWNEQLSPARISVGVKPGYIVFISDSLMSWDNDAHLMHMVTPMYFYRCSNLSFLDTNPNTSTFGTWINNRSIYYNDTNKQLFIVSNWVNGLDTAFYLKD